MILRKPYALLIKNFRVIHLLLFALMLYLVLANNSILNFYNDYIDVGFAAVQTGLSAKYINLLMYLASIMVVIAALIIYILMRQKNKPKRIYLFMIIGYIALMIYFVISSGNLRTIELYGVSPQLIRLYRDIALIVNIIQIVLIAFVFVRAFGFDIRKFNFASDLEQLEIEEKDREEFELSVDVSNRKVWRNIRKGKREFKYFYLENKSMIQFSLFLIIFVIVALIYVNFNITNKIYRQTDTIEYNGLKLKINDISYTTRDYRGNVIVKDKKYILVNLSIANTTNETVNSEKIELNIVSNDFIYPKKTNINNYFDDVYTLYNRDKIEAGGIKNITYIFEASKNDKNNDLILRYTVGYKEQGDKLIPIYKKVRIKAFNLDEKVTEETKTLDSEVKLNDLGNTTINIKTYANMDRVEYEGKTCDFNKCYPVERLIVALPTSIEYKTLIKLTSDYVWDNTTTNIKYDFVNFITKYGKIKYKYDNKYYESALTNVTPADYADGAYYFSTTRKIKDATEIYLVIKTRNSNTKYLLKS